MLVKEMSDKQSNEEIIRICVETMFGKLRELTSDANDEDLFQIILSLVSSSFCSSIATLNHHLKKISYEHRKEDMIALINQIAKKAIEKINSADILIEIYSEEIPGKMQKKAQEDARILIGKMLSKYGIDHNKI